VGRSPQDDGEARRQVRHERAFAVDVVGVAAVAVLAEREHTSWAVSTATVFFRGRALLFFRCRFSD